MAAYVAARCDLGTQKTALSIQNSAGNGSKAKGDARTIRGSSAPRTNTRSSKRKSCNPKRKSISALPRRPAHGEGEMEKI